MDVHEIPDLRRGTAAACIIANLMAQNPIWLQYHIPQKYLKKNLKMGIMIGPFCHQRSASQHRTAFTERIGSKVGIILILGASGTDQLIKTRKPVIEIPQGALEGLPENCTMPG